MEDSSGAQPIDIQETAGITSGLNPRPEPSSPYQHEKGIISATLETGIPNIDVDERWPLTYPSTGESISAMTQPCPCPMTCPQTEDFSLVCSLCSATLHGTAFRE
jgi:hypothetical protein